MRLNRFRPVPILFLKNFPVQFHTPPSSLAGRDIAAIDTASLDLIRTEDLIPNGLPKNRQELGEGVHLFEKIHGKNPYLMLRYLREIYPGAKKYVLEMVP